MGWFLVGNGIHVFLLADANGWQLALQAACRRSFWRDKLQELPDDRQQSHGIACEDCVDRTGGSRP